MVIDSPRESQICGLRQLWKLAFGDSDDFLDAFFGTAFSADRCRCVTEGEQVAAALYWFDTEFEGQKVSYLYAVATHPDYRHRGLCRRLMEDTHAILREAGYDGALLVPQEEGLRKMYAAMGYRDCTAVSEFSCRAGEPVPVRAIGREEYARLRRQYLPEGGVIQEGENLTFLENTARFYAGADFLLTASAGEDFLQGVELLGNRDAASGILAELGYPQGMFRTPGNTQPFAMFLPLKENVTAPNYFGLAFD